MTVRAVVLGLCGAAFICGFTYFNDHVIRQTYLVGSAMPPAVFGTLFVFLLGINPLLALLRRRFALSGGELAVVLTLTLAACCIPSAGLMESFPDSVMMPHRVARTDPGWRAENAIDMMPGHMIADISGDEDRALNGYVQGLATTSGQGIGLADIPWGAWGRTLAFWLPMALLVWVGLLGLSLVVHRQWSSHEQLPYPIAQFTEAMLPRDGDPGVPIYRQRIFWAGCGALCFVHLVNYVYVWIPEYFVRIPTEFSFMSLTSIFPTLARSAPWELFNFRIYFAVIGLAFLLPKDVSFSLGIGPILFKFLTGVLVGFGVSMAGTGRGWYSMGLRNSLQFGAYFGMFLMIIYTGRRYYANVFGAAFGRRSPDALEPQAVWGARIFLVCAAAFTTLLIASGLDWLLAIAFTALSFVMFVVIGRVSAESGYIFIQPAWEPAALIVAFFGARAIGPSTAIMLFMASTVLLLDTREPLMPYLLNSFRALDTRGVRVGRPAWFVAGALVLGLAVAVPATLYFKYSNGTDLGYGWASEMVPRFAFDEAVQMKQRLRTQGVLEDAETTSGFARLLKLAPDTTFLTGFGAAFALFLVLSGLRLRIPSWPIHPIMLLIWGVGPAQRFCVSILIAFVVKWAVVKYGGDRAYQRVKPAMIGLIAADVLVGLTTSLIGGIYYLITGMAPPRFVTLIG